MANIAPTATTSVGVTLNVLEVTNLTTTEPTQVLTNTKIIQPSNNVTYFDPNVSTGGQQTSQTYWITG